MDNFLAKARENKGVQGVNTDNFSLNNINKNTSTNPKKDNKPSDKSNTSTDPKSLIKGFY